MTKLLASLFALAVIVAAVPAAADCAGHKQQMTVQTAPVVTSDAEKTAPTTPVPPPATKTGG
jgi:hypothetical protein